MRIASLKILNYRSIRELHLELSPRINVFIGANNVGKSNIMSAMEWVTGTTYPSANRLERNDFFNGDEEAPLRIALGFDDGHTLSFDSSWTDWNGNIRRGLNLDGRYVSDDKRSRYVTASVGADRRILDNPATNQWTLLGRMLKDFNSRLYQETVQDEVGNPITKADEFKRRMEVIRDDLLFSITDDAGTNLMEELKHILSEETARQLNCAPNELSIDLNAYDPWNLYRTLQILITEQSSGLQMRASEMGMGVQASLTIAILRAYSTLELGNRTPIFIDEPELYLHPQARRKFYRVIEELADSGTQVFLTTHSTEFVDLGHFDQICLVRKDAERGTFVRTADPDDFVYDLRERRGINTSAADLMTTYQNAFENTGDSQKAAEAMFASRVLLVEGESESLILPFCFDRIGYDYIGKGVSIVRCGGKHELDRFYRLYSEFGIPCFILFDGDGQNRGTPDERHTVEANRSILQLFGNDQDYPDGYVHERYLGFTKRLEDSLGIGDVGKGTKAIRLFKKFKRAVQDGSATIPRWIPMIAKKLDELPSEAASALRQRDECPSYDDEDIPF